MITGKNLLLGGVGQGFFIVVNEHHVAHVIAPIYQRASCVI